MKKNLFKIILLMVSMFYFYSCQGTKINYHNLNQRSFEIVEKEKLELKSIQNKRFDTDTTKNFKTYEEIINLFGKPDRQFSTTYKYPSPNILWILEGALEGIKKYQVLVAEWDVKENDLEFIRMYIFVQENDQWVSISNLIYDSGLEY